MSKMLEEIREQPAALDRLPAPPEGKRLRYPTERPFEEAARLASLGLKLTAFRVDQPDLEKVFLNLTGRSLRD